MRIALLIALAADCGGPAATVEPPASPLEIDVTHLLSEGMGEDYLALTEVQRKMLCLTISESSGKHRPNEYLDYFDQLYEGSDQEMMTLKISDAIVSAEVLIDAAKR